MDQRRAAAALLALAACIACSAAAPTAGDHSALDLHSGHVEGCYYNFQHYGEGDRIMTNEPCLNCTCHNRMLMCYLRVCPFTKAIGQDCTVEKRADQCCPIVTCPDVPVDLLTSTSTSWPAEYGSTGLGKLDKYGCSIHGKYFPEGSKVPPTPNKPCEHCYCIRNMTTCVMQECTLHVDGCTPIYHKDVCCPVRYSCDHPEDEIPLLDDMTTTVRPTPGFLLTTTTMVPVTQMSQNCVHDENEFPDGALIKTEKACEHCYCMKGDIVCVVQECGTPMENEGKNCTSLPPRHGQCCPDTYICEGDDRAIESATEMIELTSPPRRVGVEGSGYRNEPDETYTESSLLTTEVEGSGEEFETGLPISTLENFTPDKESSSLTPTESNLQYSYSTDKKQNTIPDLISDKETTQDPSHHKITLTHSVESITDDLNAGDTTSQKDQFAPTESAFRKEDEVVSTDIAFSKENEVVPTDITFSKENELDSTESTFIKDKEKVSGEVATKIILEEATTLSSDLLDKSTTFRDEHKEFTSSEETTSPLLEYTSKSQKPSQPETTTPTIDESSRTEKIKITDGLFTLTDTEIHEGSTISDIKVFTAESTTLNPNINEVNDNILPPSRIPGEGDCLLNGITYSNNTSIPTTSNCHTGCRCISSIIKCDPIICSPPPDYMENMNDCQPIYDTPESCCPTYVCSVKETIPPQSHSQMSGTESPKPVASECSGNNCISEEKHPPSETATICTSSECLEETAIKKDECESKDCKDQLQESPAKPSQNCVDGICQVSSIIPCEGEECKIVPTKDAIPQKDLDSSSHQVPTYTCDEQSGCVEQKVTELEECVGKNCKGKNKEGEQKPSLPDCTGFECELEDKSTLPSSEEKETVSSTEKIFTEKSIEYTFGETDKKKTDTTDSDVTTAPEKLGSDTEVTRSPVIYTESVEHSSPLFEQTITDIPKQYDDSKEILQTDIPKLDTATLMPEKIVTTKEPFLTESPKLTFSDIGEHENIITETTQSQNTYSQTEKVYEKLTTEKAEQTKYIETETEESFTRRIEKLSTEKSQIYTHDSDGLHETESDDMYTKLPPHIIESENTVSEFVVTEKNYKQPDIVEEEKTPTISPEILVTEKSTTYSETSKESFTYKETSQPILSGVTDKVAIESETDKSLPEKEQVATSGQAVADTEKTEVTESITERGDIQTEPLDKLITDQEENHTKIPEVTDKHKAETKTSVIPTSTKETISTLAPDVFVTEKQETLEETITEKDVTQTQMVVIATKKEDVQTESPYTTEVIVTKAQEPMLTEIHSIETETSSEILPAQEEIQTDIPNITDSTVIKTVSPPQHESKIEITTTQTHDSSLVEQQTVESITHKIDEIEYPQVTEQATIEQHIKPTEKVELHDKENEVFDDLHIPEPMTPDDANRKDATNEEFETYTPHDTFGETTDTFSVTGPHASKTETILPDTYQEVTDSIYFTPTIEESDETTKLVAPQEVTKEKDTFTKPSYNIVTISEEKGVPTSDVGKTYTTSPITDATKSIEILETVDYSITDTHTSKVPEILASQFTETSTQYGVSITEKQTESSVEVTESVSLSTHKSSEMQEKATTLSQISSKKLPEIQSTLAEDELITEKSTEKYYSLTTTESEKYFDIEKQTEPSELHTTLRNIEEVTEEIDTKPLQEQIPTDQKLELESPNIVTSVQEDNKTPETSTNALDIITKETESHSGIPVFIQEQHELTSKTPEEEVTTYKETFSDNLTTQSTHKDLLSVDQAVTSSHELTKLANEVTESYIETTINPLVEDEKQKTTEIEESTKSQPTKSSHISEVETGSSVTATQQSEIIATTGISPAYTVRNEDRDSSTSTETIKEVSKLDETLYDTTEKHYLKEDNLPNETSSMPTFSQISQDISTESLSFPNIDDTDKNLQDFNEKSTKIPHMTLFEHSSEEVKDNEVTTESIIPSRNITTTVQPTISEDIYKFATTLMDEKEIQSEQDLISEKLLTTISSLEDSRKTTNLPMSLNTGIYQEKLPETTKSEEDVNIVEPTSKTPAEQELEEDQKQTQLYVTESGQSPEYHVTSKDLEIESSTEINISFSTLVTQFGEKTPTSSMKDEYSMNEKETPISVEETNLGIPTSVTESNINMQKEVSPVLNTEKGLLDTQQQKTTTELLPTFDKQHEISDEQSTLSELVDKMPTKYPYKEYTLGDETITIPPKLLEMEHDKENIGTEGFPTDENEEHMNTILPEIETSKTELIEETTDRVPTSTIISVPIASQITEKPVPIVTEIIEPDVTEKEVVHTEVIQTHEETTIQLPVEYSSEKQIGNTEQTPLSESTEEQFTSAEQQEKITEASDGFKVTGTKITSTQSSPSDLPEEHYAVTDSSGQEKTDDHSLVTQFPDDSSITGIQTESAIKDKFTTISLAIEEETPIDTSKETETKPQIYSTESTIVQVKVTTEAITEEETSKPLEPLGETEIQPEIYSTPSTIVKEKNTPEPTAEEITPISIVTLKDTDIQPEIYSSQSTIVKDVFSTESTAEQETLKPEVTLKETEIQPETYSTQSSVVKPEFTIRPTAEEKTPISIVTLKETYSQPEIYSTPSTIVKEKNTPEPSAEEITPISIVTLKDTDIQPEIYSTQSTIVKDVFSTESTAEQETLKPEVTLKETEIQPETYSTQSSVVKPEFTIRPTAEEKTPISIVTLKETYSQPEIYSTQSTIGKEAFTTESSYDKDTSKSGVTLKEVETQPEMYNTQSTIIKEEITIAPTAEKITPKPIVTLKETDIQPEIYSTQPTIVKESLTTITSGELSNETEKIETSTLVHVPTEVISATQGSSSSEDKAEQTHKESDLSDDTKAITESTYVFSETTPFLIELTEHAHEVIDDSSRITAEELTTVHYKPQQTEGIQELDVTKQYEDKYQTLSPITEMEHVYKDKEQFSTHIDGAMDQKIVTTAAVASDTSSSTEIISTSHSVFNLHDQGEKTTVVEDVSVTTSKSPTMTSEKDLFTTVSSDIQKVTYSIPETPFISTEKAIHIAETEKPSETNIETTLSEQGTPIATTIKYKEETSTYTPKPDEKPTMTTLSPLQEAMKPSIDDEINENLPSPDFPPSGGYGQEPDYTEEDQAFGPGTCRYGGKVYVSAQQIPRDDPCDFCFCFRSDIICLQQSCPPPIHGCHEEPIQGFCCPRYECPVSMATTVNVTTTTTTTTTTLPPHFLPHAYKGAAQRRGCQIKGHTYKVGEVVRASSGPCLQCSCGGDGQMKCDPKVCTPEPMLRQMIAAAVSAKRRR